MTRIYNPIAWSMWANVLGVYGANILLLGGILAQFANFEVEGIGIYGIIAGAFILLVEWPRSKRPKGYTIPREFQHFITPIVGKLGVLASNYFARAVLWILASIPCYFALPTVVGGATVSIASIVYFVAALKGEKWIPLPKDKPRSGNRPKISEAPKKPPPRLPANVETKTDNNSISFDEVSVAGRSTMNPYARDEGHSEKGNSDKYLLSNMPTKPTVTVRPTVRPRPRAATEKSINKFHDYPWEHAVDDTSGETYYINKNTQETTWEKPEDWDEFVKYHGGKPPSSFA